MDEAKWRSGKIKWFNTMRGYGFIIPDDGSEDVYVFCQTAIDAGIVSLKHGTIIAYRCSTGDRGPIAIELRP